jgi:peptide deformylase
MALLPVVTWPAEVLAEKAKDVVVFDEELKTLARDMFETMYENSGIGLAAPQVGRSIRMVVLDMTAGTDQQGNGQRVLINPVITERHGEVVWDEACLSLPGISCKVKRSAKVKLQARDLDNQPVEIDAEEFFAVVLQHELDHLEGVVFINRVSPLQRKFLVREYNRKARDDAAKGERSKDDDDEPGAEA